MLRTLEVTGLTKRIGFKTILAGVDLTVSRSEVLAITGPNGAGKTTLLRLIGGLARKSSGEISWDGATFSPRNAEQLRQIGLLGHRPMVYESLTAYDNLVFFSKMYGVYEKSRIEEALRRVGLNYYKHEVVVNFSRGMQQRLALARMLLHEPQLLLYDEPFTGLDAEGQRLLLATLQEMQTAGRVQVLISHNLDELQGMHYRELRMLQGKVAQFSTIDNDNSRGYTDCKVETGNTEWKGERRRSSASGWDDDGEAKAHNNLVAGNSQTAGIESNVDNAHSSANESNAEIVLAGGEEHGLS